MIKKEANKEDLPKDNIIINIIFIIITVFLVIVIIIGTSLINANNKDDKKIDIVTPSISNNNEWIDISSRTSETRIKFYKNINNNENKKWLILLQNDNINLSDYYLIAEYKCISNFCRGIIMNQQHAVVNDEEKNYLYDFTNQKIKEIDLSNINFSNYYVNELISLNEKIYGFILNDNNKMGYYSIDKKNSPIPIEYDNVSLKYLKNNYLIFSSKNINNELSWTYVDITSETIKIVNQEELEIINNDQNIYFLKKTINDSNYYNVYNNNGELLLNGQSFLKDLISISIDGNLIIYSENYRTYNLYNDLGEKISH